MPVFSDNLDGSVGDQLHLRSGWSRPVGTGVSSIISGFTGGFALTTGSSTTAPTLFTPATQPSGADQYVTAHLSSTAFGNIMPISVRCDPTSNLGVGYFAQHGVTGLLRLYRRAAAGNFVSMGSAAITAADLTANPVTLKAVGNQISVEFLGTTVIGPVTDNNISSGSVGIMQRGGALSSSSVIDSWESGEVGGAPASVDGTGAANAPALTLGAPVASASGAQTIAAVSGSGAAVAPAIVLGSPVASGAGALTVAFVTGTGAATAPVLSLGAPVASGAGALTIAAVSGTGAATAPALTLGTPIAAAVGAYSEGGAIYPLITVAAERKRITWPAEPKRTTWHAERKRVTFPAWPNGVRRMINLDPKGAAEILTICVPITNWPMVSTENAVTDYTVTVTSGDITATKLDAEDDGTLRFRISGGTAGKTAGIQLLATLEDGQKPDQVFSVFVR